MKTRWDKRIKAKHFKQFCIQKQKESAKIISKSKGISRCTKEILKVLTDSKLDFDKITESFDNSNVSSRNGSFISLLDVSLSRKEKNIIDVNDALFQLTSSVEKLLDIVVYFVSMGFQEDAMSDYKLIRYHIENYLNQNYIVQQRLKRYLDLLKKRYKSKNKLKKVKIIDKSHSDLNHMMSAFIRKRGYHVHDQEFRDFLLFGLMNLCSAIESGSMKVDKDSYKSCINGIKMYWMSKMVKHNWDLITNLDRTFATFIEHGIQ